MEVKPVVGDKGRPESPSVADLQHLQLLSAEIGDLEKQLSILER
jgi:hypothetical protein